MTLDQFWTVIAAAPRATLLLDYDGTLAPFRVERDQAIPYPGVREKLIAIRKGTETRVVIISGRSISDLLPLLGLDPPPEVWGCHGWEHLTEDGICEEVALPKPSETGLEKARLWIEKNGLTEFCETKPASLAIHWRGQAAGQIEALRSQVLNIWRPLASENQLEVHPFNGGLELRCPGRSKGTAIASILKELEPTEPVAFLGDDLTDEDGFEAIKGRGVGVLVNNQLRKTHADLQISPPSELLDFLVKWHINAPRKEIK